MNTIPERHAISRAEFFLARAEECTAEQRAEFEAFLEASIVFARAALHRMKSQYESHHHWAQWFASLKNAPEVEFFRNQRDFILKEAPPRVGQIISFNPIKSAAQLYYFEEPSIDAASTVRKHLTAYSSVLLAAEEKFRK